MTMMMMTMTMTMIFHEKYEMLGARLEGCSSCDTTFAIGPQARVASKGLLEVRLRTLLSPSIKQEHQQQQQWQQQLQ
jgi:hypothetical protein